MSELVRICSRAELPPEGEAREISVRDRTLCVATVNGQATAIDNVCPHRGGPLGQGIIEEGQVICPWHAWAFDLKTGICSHNGHAKVEVFKILLDGEDVVVEL